MLCGLRFKKQKTTTTTTTTTLLARSLQQPDRYRHCTSCCFNCIWNQPDRHRHCISCCFNCMWHRPPYRCSRCSAQVCLSVLCFSRSSHRLVGSMSSSDASVWTGEECKLFLANLRSGLTALELKVSSCCTAFSSIRFHGSSSRSEQILAARSHLFELSCILQM